MGGSASCSTLPQLPVGVVVCGAVASGVQVSGTSTSMWRRSSAGSVGHDSEDVEGDFTGWVAAIFVRNQNKEKQKWPLCVNGVDSVCIYEIRVLNKYI